MDDKRAAKEVCRVVSTAAAGPRALPVGVVWPMFKDGELVSYGDYILHEGRSERVQAIYFYKPGHTILSLTGVDHEMMHHLYGDERVERPTSPKPVLDRDGVEIKVGDTVYAVGNDMKPKKVTAITNYSHPIVHYEFVKGFPYEYEPQRLTHEIPDSWDELVKDATPSDSIIACEYFGHRDRDCRYCQFDGEDCAVAMAEDIIRRAKALAGVDS